MIATPLSGAGRVPQAGLTLIQDLLLDLPLQTGERVRAWVAEVSGDLALLVLGGRQVRARTEVTLTPGQSVLLEVRRTDPQVVLRLVAARSAAEAAADPAAEQASQAVRRALVALRRPLDPQVVDTLTSVVRRFPEARQEAAAAAAAWLHATGGPVTPEDVLHLARAGEEPVPWSLAARLRALADLLADTARATAGASAGDTAPPLAIAAWLRAWGWRPPADRQPPGHVPVQEEKPAAERPPGDAVAGSRPNADRAAPDRSPAQEPGPRAGSRSGTAPPREPGSAPGSERTGLPATSAGGIARSGREQAPARPPADPAGPAGPGIDAAPAEELPDLPAALARAQALLSGRTAGAAGRNAGELLAEIRAILRAVPDGARADIPAPLVVPLPVVHPHLGEEVVVVRKRDGRRGASGGEDERELELFLTTPNLGPLRIWIRRADAVSVTVVAADSGAREWLAAALPDLRQGLSRLGLRPGRLEATLGATEPPPLVPAPEAGLPPGLDRRV